MQAWVSAPGASTAVTTGACPLIAATRRRLRWFCISGVGWGWSWGQSALQLAVLNWYVGRGLCGERGAQPRQQNRRWPEQRSAGPPLQRCPSEPPSGRGSVRPAIPRGAERAGEQYADDPRPPHAAKRIHGRWILAVCGAYARIQAGLEVPVHPLPPCRLPREQPWRVWQACSERDEMGAKQEYVLRTE